jgi:hypothetical protein
MAQVAKMFKEKRDAKLAKSVSSELGICLASFYKYARGEDLPRPEVLRAAKERWGVAWDLIDSNYGEENRRIA